MDLDTTVDIDTDMWIWIQICGYGYAEKFENLGMNMDNGCQNHQNLSFL